MKRFLVVLFLLATTSVAARADTVYNLTFNNFGQPGSLGTVTTSLVSGHIHVDVQLAAGYVLHSNDAFGFNVASGFSGISIANLSTLEFVAGNGGSFNGYGNRDYSLDGKTTAQARIDNVQSFSFNVFATGGFTDSAQVKDIAVQIAQVGGQQLTGFAASSGETTVPEPATMVLFGTGLLGLAGLLRRRFR